MDYSGHYEYLNDAGQLIKFLEQLNTTANSTTAKICYVKSGWRGAYTYSHEPLPGYHAFTIDDLNRVVKSILAKEGSTVELPMARELLKNIKLVISTLGNIDSTTKIFIDSMMDGVNAIVQRRQHEFDEKEQREGKQSLASKDIVKAIELHPEVKKAIDDFAKGDADDETKLRIALDAFGSATARPLILHRFGDFGWNKESLSKFVNSCSMKEVDLKERLKWLVEIFKHSPTVAIDDFEKFGFELDPYKMEDILFNDSDDKNLYENPDTLAIAICALKKVLKETARKSRKSRKGIHIHELLDFFAKHTKSLGQFQRLELVDLFSTFSPAMKSNLNSFSNTLNSFGIDRTFLLQQLFNKQDADKTFLIDVLLTVIRESPDKAAAILTASLPAFSDPHAIVQSVLNQSYRYETFIKVLVPLFRAAPEIVSNRMPSYVVPSGNMEATSKEKGIAQARALYDLLVLLKSDNSLSDFADKELTSLDEPMRHELVKLVLSRQRDRSDMILSNLLQTPEEIIGFAAKQQQSDPHIFFRLYCAIPLLHVKVSAQKIYEILTTAKIHLDDMMALPDAVIAEFSKEQKFNIAKHMLAMLHPGKDDDVFCKQIANLYSRFSLDLDEQSKLERSFVLSGTPNRIYAVLLLHAFDIAALDQKLKFTVDERKQLLSDIFKHESAVEREQMLALRLMKDLIIPLGCFAKTLDTYERYKIALQISLVSKRGLSRAFAFLEAAQPDDWKAKKQDGFAFLKFITHQNKEIKEHAEIDAAFVRVDTLIGYLAKFHAERDALSESILYLFISPANLLQWYQQTKAMDTPSLLLASQAQLLEVSPKEISAFFEGITSKPKVFKDSKNVQELLSFMGKLSNWPSDSRAFLLNQIFLGKENHAERLQYISVLLENPDLFKRSYSLEELHKLFTDTLIDIMGLQETKWKDAKDFHERYQLVEKLFESRIPGALMVYSAKINERPENEREELRKAFASFVDVLLSDVGQNEKGVFFPTFTALRYDTPHLKSEPMQKSGAVDAWKQTGLSLSLSTISNPYIDNIEDIFKSKFTEEMNILESQEQGKPFWENCRKLFALLKESDIKAVQKQYASLKEDFAALKKSKVLSNGAIDAMQRFVANTISAKAHILNPKSTVVVSDHPLDLFLAARETNGCMSISRESEYNRALLGYVNEGESKVIDIPDSNGKVLARAILKLEYGEPTNDAMLLLEKPYDDGNGTYECFFPMLLQCAQQYAEKLSQERGKKVHPGKKINLVTRDASLFKVSGKYDSFSGTLSCLGRSSLPEGDYRLVAYGTSEKSGPGVDRAPLKYSDALRHPSGNPTGFTSGPFSIGGDFVLLN